MLYIQAKVHPPPLKGPLFSTIFTDGGHPRAKKTGSAGTEGVGGTGFGHHLCTRFFDMKTLYIPGSGIACAYSVTGNGPDVILLHGLCESGEIWHAHAQALSRQYRVLVPDLPGYGRSEPYPDGDFSLERMQKAVFAMADAEGMDTFSLAGHSMGGYTALAMLEAQPRRIERISLFHSTSRADSDEKKKGRDKSVKVLRQNRDLFFREVFKNLFNSERLEEFMPLIQHLYAQSAAIETETVVHTLFALRDRKDRFALLRDYAGPVSYFIGRHDNVLPAGELIREAEALGVPFHVSEISGHMGFYEAGEETAGYLEAFLRETQKK